MNFLVNHRMFHRVFTLPFPPAPGGGCLPGPDGSNESFVNAVDGAADVCMVEKACD
jgi:hypothetical protein